MDMGLFFHWWDWIDKLDGVRGDVVALALGKGGGHYIEFLPPVCGGSTEAMLRKYRIGMWGRGVMDSNKEENGLSHHWCCCHVRASQATWARYLMAREGCQLRRGPTPNVAGQIGLPMAWKDRLRGETLEQQRTRLQPAQPATGTAKPKPQKAKRGGWFDL